MYAYSPAGDLVSRRVKQAAIGGLGSGGSTPDNARSALLGYDRLGRLVEHEAGTLGVDANGEAEITSPWRRSAWSMDTLGNLKGAPAGDGNPALPGLLVEADRDGDSALDTLAATHATARNNRLESVGVVDSRLSSQPTPTPIANDRAGNVVCDDLYFYQYDAWNRLIQVRHRGTLEFDADGSAAGGAPGEWIVHYTYDALGRLVRKQLPHNVELEQVRIEEYYYDGVRRVSETLTTPLFSSGGGPVGGGGGGGGGGDQTQTVTEREYVWAPPPSGYVDECVAQIDRSNVIRYVIQDASYDVVALVSPQTSSQASKVIAQYTWDPYGQVLTAEYSGLAATYNKLGHHGLFADRLDAGYQSATLAAGFMASTHLPARIIYQVRNRTYDPSTQRWLQRDPNATGQVVLGSLANHGRAATTASGAVSAIELATLYGDSMSLYGYVGNGPVLGNDPLGMFIDLLGPTSTLEFELDYMQDTLETGSRLADFVANTLSFSAADQSAMADWAMDWSMPDNLFDEPATAEEADGGGAQGSEFAYATVGTSTAKQALKLTAQERRLLGRIGSYAELAKYTAGRKGKIQAHHLIEKRYTKAGRALAGMNDKEFPAVILSRKEHKVLTTRLNREFDELRRRYGDRALSDRRRIKEVYARVYAGKPEWLDRISVWLD